MNSRCRGPETDADWYVTLQNMERVIENASGGSVAVEILPVGALVEPDSVVDAVANGAIEGGHIISGMSADRVPSALITEMPYGVQSSQEHHELHFDNGIMELIREEYANANMHLAAIGTSGEVTIMSNRPINTVEDFDGMKVWVIPNVGWVTEFGAAPTEVPGFDMYSAMRLGTIDGFT